MYWAVLGDELEQDDTAFSLDTPYNHQRNDAPRIS